LIGEIDHSVPQLKAFPKSLLKLLTGCRNWRTMTNEPSGYFAG
jgi:hypothetical protein